MIALTLAGESSRFYNNGYKKVKYLLEYNGKSILENILGFISRDEKLLLIINQKHKTQNEVRKICNSMEFTNYRIVELKSTDGQLTSMLLGLKFILKNETTWFNLNEPLIIYNGDTIRKLSFNYHNFDGYIEVFKAKGEHWSFTDRLGIVSLITEKKKISDFCSSGFYGFKTINLFIKYSEYYNFQGEKYIAPLYNELIKNNLFVASFYSELECFVLCGTPEEYELSIKKLKRGKHK